MSPATKSIIIHALNGNLAVARDNLYRACATFRDCTPEQMAQPYGQSSQTRQEILDGYERREAELRAAVAEVLALP